MIIYNVTVTVDRGVAAEWVNWMKKTHIPDVLACGQFAEANLHHLLEQDESEGVTYVVQYKCTDIDKYNTYITNHAPAMREHAFAAFGNKFIAMRTVMELL